ncbi:hypothetical protein [Polaromonas sp. UC242_47]|uniref:hypothetical protein n=1 Tax=Polaromonas sp. UC242_47 TaxID=3374626 RepID=UPI00378FF154
MNSGKRSLRKNVLRRYLIALGVAIISLSAAGFQVLPKVSDVDRKLAGLGSNWVLDPLAQFGMGGVLPMIKSPVHEAITLAAVGCNTAPAQEKDCVVLNAVKANRILLYGVRWPDDPPFSLDRNNPPGIADCDARVTMRSTAQPKCWKGLFDDAGAKAKISLLKKPGQPAFGPGHYMLYRSHYGDLQFFHSMAAYDGERAADTQARMKMWAQFLWGVAIGQVPTDRFIRELGFAELTPYFPGDITATNLFATGIVEVRKELDKVALGVLLHMLQDSFSQAHTDRLPETGGQCPQIPRFAKPGKVAQFYGYARQAGHMHDEEDTFNALGLQTLQTTPTVIDVSRNFVTLWSEKASWEDASKLFDCVIDVQNADTPAGPGRFVEQPVHKSTGSSEAIR